jgi:hypothetical protein
MAMLRRIKQNERPFYDEKVASQGADVKAL